MNKLFLSLTLSKLTTSRSHPKPIHIILDMLLITILKQITGIKIMYSFTLSLFTISINVSLIILHCFVRVYQISCLGMRIVISSENTIWALILLRGLKLFRRYPFSGISGLRTLYGKKLRLKTLVVRDTSQGGLDATPFPTLIIRGIVRKGLLALYD